MKIREGLEVQLHEFLISELDGGEPLASRHCRFVPENRKPVSNEQEAGT